MKHLAILTCIILLLTEFTSCKKGEEDPFLSLRSRKARLTGTWVLKEAQSTFVSSDSFMIESEFYEYSDVYVSAGSSTFENDELTFQNRYESGDEDYRNGSTRIDKSKYEMKLQIRSDGSFTLSERDEPTYSSYDSYYISGNNTTSNFEDTTYSAGEIVSEYSSSGTWFWIDGSKNKDMVALGSFGLMKIQRLANKEMILIDEYNDHGSYDSETQLTKSTSMSTSRMVFEKES